MTQLTRRDFLRLCGTSSIGLALAACGVTPAPTAAPAPPNTPLPTSTALPTATSTFTNVPAPTSTASGTATTTDMPIVVPQSPLTIENFRDGIYQMPIAGSTLESGRNISFQVAMDVRAVNETSKSSNGILFANGEKDEQMRRLYLVKNVEQWYLVYQDGTQSKYLGKVMNPITSGDFGVEVDITGTRVTVKSPSGNQSFSLPQSLYIPRKPMAIYIQTSAHDSVKLNRLSLDSPISHVPADALRFTFDKRGLAIGAAVGTWAFPDSPQYASTAKEFNSLTPTGEFEWGLLRPIKDAYDFPPIDDLINFARQNNMKIRGEVLYGSGFKPDWLTASRYSREQLIGIIKEHITTVVNRYKDAIKEWRINEYGNWDYKGDRTDYWYNNVGPEYVDIATDVITGIDPDALVILNYYTNIIGGQGREIRGKRADEILQVAGRLHAKGHNVALGWEGHLYGKNTRYGMPEVKSIKAELKEEMERAGQAGIPFLITEADDLVDQERTFREMVEAGLEINGEFNRPVFLGITFWGVDDGHSWFRRPDMSALGGAGPNATPLPFDDNYQRTKGWQAISTAISGR